MTTCNCCFSQLAAQSAETSEHVKGLYEIIGKLTMQVGRLAEELKAREPAAAPDPEPAAEPVEEPKKKRRTGWQRTAYASPAKDPILVKEALDLCAAGHSNWEIAKELGLSPTMVSRIRSRSEYVKNLWPSIDMWHKKHPRANIYGGVKLAWLNRDGH